MNLRKTWSEVDTADPRIPRASANYLRDVGLPEFHLASCYRISSRQPGFGVVPLQPSLLTLTCEPPHICIDLESNATVVDIGYGDGAQVFVNGSVQQFGASLHAWLDYASRVKEIDKDEEACQALIDELERNLTFIDGAAFVAPVHFWPMVIEQCRTGLL